MGFLLVRAMSLMEKANRIPQPDRHEVLKIKIEPHSLVSQFLGASRRDAQASIACAVIVPFNPSFEFITIIVITTSPSFSTLFLSVTKVPHIMDTLVSAYSQPAFQDEGYSSDEQQELVQAVPPLSLQFALPPMPNVSFTELVLSESLANALLAFCLSPRADRRSLKSKLSHQAGSRYDDSGFQIPRRDYRRHRFKSYSGELDSESDGQEGY